MPIESKANDLSLPLQKSTSDCCRTTEEGAAICLVPESGQPSACGCNISTAENPPQATTVRGKIRSGALFALACLTSPCCTPLYVPLLLVLLAGTPAAVWLAANIGWVYGTLTIISIITFVLALRRWPKVSGKWRGDTAVSIKAPSIPKTNYSLEETA